MRDALNNNPLAQIGVVAVLLIAVAVFVMSSGGGEEEESAPATEATVAVAGTNATGTATGATPGEAVEGAIDAAGAAAAATAGIPATIPARPLPRRVLRAWKANRTVVLLFVRDGGIDDRLVRVATDGLDGFRRATVFVVPAAKISRYAAITQGVGVNRVPALVVLTPKRIDQTVPTASVSYGFQNAQSVTQAVVDAGYKGPTVDYHP